jgi:hypothetical protein
MTSNSIGFLVSVVTCAIATVACGSGSAKIGPDDGGSGSLPGEGPVRSGSRLRAASYVNSDGSQAFAGFFDTQLAKDCTFQRLTTKLGACIPADVYTVPGSVFGSRLSTSNTQFYLDATCGTPKGIILREESCTKYGLMRVTPDATASTYPGCFRETSAGYLVLKPFDLSKQKAYRYGLPSGGGQCCSCFEITSAPENAGLYIYESPTDENVTGLGVVTGTYTP